MTSQVNQKYIHSFVICAFQESKFLEESIKSCIDQFSVKQNKSQLFYILVRQIIILNFWLTNIKLIIFQGMVAP